MASLPPLNNWESTRAALHQSLQPLRSTRLLGSEEQPNELHYSTWPTPYGATTGPLNFGGELKLDYGRGAVIYERDGAEVFGVTLQGKNQTSLFDAVFAEFEKAGHEFEPNRSKVTETTPYDFNPSLAKDYAEAQWRVYTAMARFKATVFGAQSPIVLWPHGFDLSTLWFPAGVDEHKDPQMNFGFSPGTPDRPYLYFYAWPHPAELPEAETERPPLPYNGQWVTWSGPGAMFMYDDFVNEANPEEAITNALRAAYELVSPMMRKLAAES
ncbi:MAG: hypothetical protein D6737_10495 [Chloroflexi bacterium]|nr:MAG: hypothetical protein CUN54_00075 [Phototrophicales bacterium]RMF79662.1 MAG: hypothetical protein D6737_10495 [Chloroflexota bacterium]